MRLVLPICLLAAACSVRQLERMDRWKAGGELELSARGIRREAPAAGGSPSDTIDAGLGLRAHGGPGKLGIALGLDLHLGGGTDGGFSYETALRPLGAGLYLGGVGSLMITGGAGFSGITGQIPFTFRLPVEARLEVDLAPRIHVRMFGELDGLTHHGERDKRAGFALRLGKGGQRYNEKWGNGGFVGVIVGERGGIRELGLTIGYGITDRYAPDLRELDPIGL
jgi:hypothetical protein